jgi:hypothetical protein
MGYIVNVTVILNDISRTADSSVTESPALKVMDVHVRSSRRDGAQGYAQLCYGDICDRFANPQKDLVLVINSVGQY